jgi:ankyrin repeat protein
MSQQSAAPCLKFNNHGNEDSCSKNKTASTGWSFNKKIDELSNMFHFSHKSNNLKVKITHTDEANSCPITSDSGCCSSNSSSQSTSTTLTKDTSNNTVTNVNEYSMYADLTVSDPPLKMRKLDVPIYSQVNNNNHQSTGSQSSSASSSTSSSPSNHNHLKSNTPSIFILPPPSLPNSTTKSPEYYPSPPESIPDTSFLQANNRLAPLNPINFKGAAYGITPLMVFVMSRNKAKIGNGSQEQKGKMLNSGVEAEIIDTFFTGGADVNAQNLDGETALHIAARCGLYEICDRLIKKGALLNLHDNYGRNVLHTAVCSNELDIVKLILTYCSLVINAANSNNNNNMNSINIGLDTDEKYDLIDTKTNDDLNETSLIIASRLNLNSIVQLLVDFNATINATDSEGRSALHWCSKVNNFNGALTLLQSGANVNMQDNDEKTPLSSALNELCTQQVVELLIKYDAFVSAEDEVKYNKMKSILESNTELFPPKIDFSKHVKKEKEQSNMVNELHKSANHLLLTTTTTTTKENQQNNTLAKKIKPNSVSTKRKLSETFANSSSNENGIYVDSQNVRNHKISKTSKKNALNVNTNGNALNVPSYTPLTPSPPQPFASQYQHTSTTVQDVNNCYSNYSNNLQGQNQYFSQNQQMYANPAFNYSFENTNEMLMNMNRKSQNYFSENSAYTESNAKLNNLNYTNQQYQQSNLNYKSHGQSYLELQNNSIYTTSNNLYFNTNLNETYAAYF